MKNLCRKGGRVHPSASSFRDAYSVLRILPVAVAALSAALPPEDQEVLAYLIARSPDVPAEIEMKSHRRLRKNTKGAVPELDDETPSWSPEASADSTLKPFLENDALPRRSSSGRNRDSKNTNKRAVSNGSACSGGPTGLRNHSPSFECSCFQCYTSFWSRWNASPSRELIHEAIDLFEEITAAENAGKGKNRSGKGLARSGKEEKAVIDSVGNITRFRSTSDKEAAREEEPKLALKAKQVVPLAFEGGVAEDGATERQTASARPGVCLFGGRSLMRRMFPDIMGFVADHLWTAWSSPLRPADD